MHGQERSSAAVPGGQPVLHRQVLRQADDAADAGGLLPGLRRPVRGSGQGLAAREPLLRVLGTARSEGETAAATEKLTRGLGELNSGN